MLDKYDEFIEDFNYRPLVLSKTLFCDILKKTNVAKVGFYVVPFKNSRITRQLLTLRYVLFDSSNRPLYFDGEVASIRNTNILKAAGDAIPNLDKTSFVMSRAALHAVFSTDDTTINTITIENDVFITFMLIKEGTAAAPSLGFSYIVTSILSGGIGGPASTATSPAP